MKEDALRILLTADAVGGVWQYSLDLARGLSVQGIESIVAVLGPSPSKAQLKAASGIEGLTLVDTGLPLDWLARTRTSVRTAGEKIAKLAAGHNVDLVQLNAPALAAEARFGVPVVAVAHSCLATWWAAVKGNDIDPVYKWRSDLAGEGLRKADLVVAPSAAFAEATRLAHQLEKAPVTVHNGRSPLPLPRVAPHDFAFTAGRLWDKGKNAATLDRVAARLAIPFYAAGPERGPNGDSIELLNARPLGNLGERELARRLAAKPVFVSAAIYEPFGLAALEAANAGCPLILSDIPTFRELWEGPATFVDPMDHEGYARAVSEIIGDEPLRASLGKAAKERASRYTPEAMAQAMAGIYRKLVKSGAAAKVAA
ncbi:MAG TPA: glycosyltransferase family 4 protein [Allosphingosinicella sp.]|uniref:glycosyltransferase family 4 protein n=1 Tax=Allosphingosinicella sp. TaxID=2823234 RepID=UPI002ED77E0F